MVLLSHLLVIGSKATLTSLHWIGFCSHTCTQWSSNVLCNKIWKHIFFLWFGQPSKVKWGFWSRIGAFQKWSPDKGKFENVRYVVLCGWPKMELLKNAGIKWPCDLSHSPLSTISSKWQMNWCYAVLSVTKSDCLIEIEIRLASFFR